MISLNKLVEWTNNIHGMNSGVHYWEQTNTDSEESLLAI